MKTEILEKPTAEQIMEMVSKYGDHHIDVTRSIWNDNIKSKSSDHNYYLVIDDAVFKMQSELEKANKANEQLEFQLRQALK